LTRIADVILRIYNVAGELVYSSEKKKAADGTFVWKRKNNAGNKVASGVYIYSIEAVLYETKIHKQGSIAIVM
jgi:flagellar hook assembly protein FlgD